MDRHLTNVSMDLTGYIQTAVIFPASNTAIRHDIPAGADVNDVTITPGTVRSVVGDDYGFPGAVLAHVKIDWHDGEDADYTFDAAAWDAALLGEEAPQ